MAFANNKEISNKMADKAILRYFAMFLLVSHSFCGAVTNSHTLCEDSEVVVFSCAMATKKRMSLCLAERAGDRISYRFGTSRKIELTYSAKPNQRDGFLYNHYFRYNADYEHIYFTIHPYEYTIFHYYDATASEPESYGVVVSKDGEEQARLYCAGEVLNYLNRITTHLRCNEENTLGCTL